VNGYSRFCDRVALIALGINNGMTGILVLSGETTMEDVRNASEDKKPTYIIGSVAEIE